MMPQPKCQICGKEYTSLNYISHLATNCTPRKNISGLIAKESGAIKAKNSSKIDRIEKNKKIVNLVCEHKKLDKYQIRFLQSQGISLDQVFDASGLSTSKYKEIMSERNLLIAYGVTPCSAVGHTLRTRAGHCAQCDTSKIAYLLRHNAEAYVYVAFSKSKNLSKIGTCKSINQREESLNNHGYGNIYDWDIVFHKKCKNAGKIETTAHSYLKGLESSRVYDRWGTIADSREIFDCVAQTAINALERAIQSVS
jgi:T5orf172 domain